MPLFKGQRRKGMIVTTIREAIKEQRKSIKNRSFKEQFSFFWEYYGIKTICLILAIAILIAFIVSMATKKNTPSPAYFWVLRCKIAPKIIWRNSGRHPVFAPTLNKPKMLYPFALLL